MNSNNNNNINNTKNDDTKDTTSTAYLKAELQSLHTKTKPRLPVLTPQKNDYSEDDKGKEEEEVNNSSDSDMENQDLQPSSRQMLAKKNSKKKDILDQQPKTCTYVFRKGKNEGKRCAEKLPSGPQYKHGADRYCNTCLNKLCVQDELQEEVFRDCDGNDCTGLVLKPEYRALTHQTEYSDLYCEYCLQSRDIHQLIAMSNQNQESTSYSSFEYDGQEEEEKEDHENGEMMKEIRLNKNLDALHHEDNEQQENVEEEQEQEQEIKQQLSFLQHQEFTEKHLEDLLDILSIEDSKQMLQTYPIRLLIKPHVRYMIEVFLLDSPTHQAELFVWILQHADKGFKTKFHSLLNIVPHIKCKQRKSFGACSYEDDISDLQHNLLSFKQLVIQKLIKCLQQQPCAVLRNREALSNHVKKVLEPALRQRMQEVSPTLFNEFLVLARILYRRNRQQLQDPLQRFIVECIVNDDDNYEYNDADTLIPRGTSYLSTTDLHHLFLEWAERNNIQHKLSSIVNFGKELNQLYQQRLVPWLIRIVKKQARHYFVQFK